MKTFTATPADIEKEWIVIDGEASFSAVSPRSVAMRLRGKHKPTFTPSMDMGDNVIVINAEKVQVTGNKRNKPNYLGSTGFPGRHQVAHDRSDPRGRPTPSASSCRPSSACCRATA